MDEAFTMLSESALYIYPQAGPVQKPRDYQKFYIVNAPQNIRKILRKQNAKAVRFTFQAYKLAVIVYLFVI